MPTYGSLFSGVGGFDMGFDQAEYECVFQVEWDKHCQQILAKHWPEVPKWSDVQDVNGAEVPPCDVLIFGSPCQDLSVAGKRAGLDGDRSSMFYEATRIIKEMRDATNSIYPRATIWENVPGALSSNKGADFGVVLSSLADIGAITQEYAVLDAQYFGVPQRRRRIFLVSIFDPTACERCPDPLLPLFQGSRGDFAKGRKARQGVTRNVEGSIDTSGQWAAGSTDDDILTTSVTSKCSKGSGGPSGSEHYNMVVESPFIIDRAAFNQGVNAQYNPIIEQREIMPSLVSMGPHAIAQPFVKSRRAQNDTDDETWIPCQIDGSQVASTLRGFGHGWQGQHNSTNAIAQEPQPPFVFDATRHDDFRMDTEIVPTLKQRMGTGGGQVPMIAEPVAYDEYNDSINETHHAIRVGTKQSTGVIQPTYSFDTQFGSNAAVFEDQSPTLKSTQQSPSITMPGLAVRRLTPLECERLMGWPDDHTRWTADGKEQADTNRYKQCGNGVATPVAKWVAGHIKALL